MLWTHQGGPPAQGERGSCSLALHAERRSEGRPGTGWATLGSSRGFCSPGLWLCHPRSEQRPPPPPEHPPGFQRALSSRVPTNSSKASFP